MQVETYTHLFVCSVNNDQFLFERQKHKETSNTYTLFCSTSRTTKRTWHTIISLTRVYDSCGGNYVCDVCVCVNVGFSSEKES